MKKEWLKNVLEKQKQKKKTHSVNVISEYVRNNINECKKRRLTSYHVPLIISGYPKYDIYQLYNNLKTCIEPDENININDGQIIISWGKKKKKTYPEIYKILSMIESAIEKNVDNYKTECFFDIPVLIQGIPMYNYEKTARRVIKHLIKEGFTVKRVSYIKILISWSNVKLKYEKIHENEKDVNDEYFIELKSLKKKANKFLNS